MNTNGTDAGPGRPLTAGNLLQSASPLVRHIFESTEQPGDRLALLGILKLWQLETFGTWIPDELFLVDHALESKPFTEVVIPQRDAIGRWSYALLPRAPGDRYWPGEPYNIPGSMWWRDHTIEEGCNRTAQSELGVRVRFLVEVMTHKWFDAPYGRPVSHVCICVPLDPLHEGIQFFSLGSLPAMVSVHQINFLKACERWLCEHPDAELR